jgi:hypothetical protein
MPSLTPRRVPARLEYLDRIRGHPDIDLLESGLDSFFEFDEELTAFGYVSGIHKHPDQFIAK